MPGLDSPAPPAPRPAGRLIVGRFGEPPPRPPRESPRDILAAVAHRAPAATSRTRNTRELRMFVSWLAGRPADELTDGDLLAALTAITEADLTAYLDTRRNLAATTTNNTICTLRALCRRLTRTGLLPYDPSADLRMRKVSQVSATAWLTADQAQRLIAACAGPRLIDARDYAIVVTMLRTGLRRSEIASITVGDIDTIGPHRVLWITGKGGARERVKLAPEAHAAIATWCARAGISAGYIWRATTADGTTCVRQGPLCREAIAQRIVVRAGLAGLTNITPHSLRHTFVTLALRAGASLAKVQAAARHANPQTTMRYAHDMDSLDDNAVDYISL